MLTGENFPFVLCVNSASEAVLDEFVALCGEHLPKNGVEDMQLYCFGENILKERLCALNCSVRVFATSAAKELYSCVKYPDYAWNGTTFLNLT